MVPAKGGLIRPLSFCHFYFQLAAEEASDLWHMGSSLQNASRGSTRTNSVDFRKGRNKRSSEGLGGRMRSFYDRSPGGIRLQIHRPYRTDKYHGERGLIFAYGTLPRLLNTADLRCSCLRCGPCFYEGDFGRRALLDVGHGHVHIHEIFKVTLVSLQSKL
jgi:hypothetical protein